MKKALITLVLVTGICMGSFAQTWQETWSDMSKEEKMAKLKSFRDENQAYLKDSLGMTAKQLKSIDSVNSIFLKGVNQLEGSSGSDDEKLAKAKILAQTRGDNLDMIMGADKRKKFSQYLYDKLQKSVQ
jgi:DNA-directed RNA polymerase sigma subunit (sigma70/sigma32)